jgi:ubiquinone/menaquinone biosynthesis C-methylase UbiE
MDLQQVADIFNGRAANYVTDEWHRRYAEQLVEVTPLREGDRVLDAGTGTGFAARAIARRVGPAGHVLGVDISPRMLEQARIVIDGAHLTNVDFLEADVSDLRDLATASFDAVVCSAGLLYMPVVKALREWHRLLDTDGVIAFSTMRAGSPLAGRVFRDCAKQFGLDMKDRSEPLGTEERCRQVLEETGFDRVQLISGRVDFEHVDYALAWDANFRAAGSEAARALSTEQQNMLRLQFLEAIQHAAQVNPDGVARADAIFAIARRPKERRPKEH